MLALVAGPAELPDDGPVQFGEADVTQRVGILADRGSKVVLGATYVVNTRDKPATLRAASLEGDVPEDAARVVEVRALNPPEHNGELVGAGPWPFEDWAQASSSLANYTVAPGDEAELLFVIDIRRTGHCYWPSTGVTYEHDGELFEATTPWSFMVRPTTFKDCSQLSS